jgi:hypothetical protein
MSDQTPTAEEVKTLELAASTAMDAADAKMEADRLKFVADKALVEWAEAKDRAKVLLDATCSAVAAYHIAAIDALSKATS